MSAPEKVMNAIKAFATRRLKEAELEIGRQKRWTRHGSTKYLWSIVDIEATIQYVVYEQGIAMAVFENVDRKVNDIVF
jgi:hypothetical protein